MREPDVVVATVVVEVTVTDKSETKEKKDLRSITNENFSHRNPTRSLQLDYQNYHDKDKCKRGRSPLVVQDTL